MTNHLTQDDGACNSPTCAEHGDERCPTCGEPEGFYVSCKREMREMPRNIAVLDFWGWATDHPIITHYPEPVPRDKSRRAQTTLLAFIAWSGQDGVSIRVPGNNKSDLTLCLIDGASVGVDLADAWNWHKDYFKDWLGDLNFCDLIDDGLYTSALHALKHSSYDRTPLSRDLRLAVLKKTHGHCVYCGCELTLTAGYSNSFHADHVLPVTKGGADDIGNLVPACAQCNTTKAAKTSLVFLSPLEDLA